MNLVYSDLSVIVDGSPVRTSNRSFMIPRNSNYGFSIKNRSANFCNYCITIDNKCVGTWRVKPFDTIFISRPVHSRRRFYFIDPADEPALEGRHTGTLVVEEEQCFGPEYLGEWETDGDLETDCGATVLLNPSTQRFVTAPLMSSLPVATFYMGLELARNWELL